MTSFFFGFGLGVYMLGFAFVLHNFAKESGYSYAGGIEKFLLGCMVTLFSLGPVGFLVSLFF